MQPRQLQGEEEEGLGQDINAYLYSIKLIKYSYNVNYVSVVGIFVVNIMDYDSLCIRLHKRVIFSKKYNTFRTI